jgi:hypothetical protein
MQTSSTSNSKLILFCIADRTCVHYDGDMR